jgi:hypothetical protein
VTEEAAVALFSIEETPCKEAQNVLLDAGACNIGTRLQKGELNRKQIAQLRPHFGQLIQDAMDYWRRPAPDNYTEELFELLAAMGENADTVLPDLFDLCRDDGEMFRQWLFQSAPKGEQYWRSTWRGPFLGPATGHLGFPISGIHLYLRSQGKSGFAPLARGLKDPEPKARFLALGCAGLLGVEPTALANEIHVALLDRRGFPKRQKDYAEVESSYLIEALQTISRLGAKGKPLVKDVAGLLKHKDAKVQAMAAWVLGVMGEDAREALDALERVPDDADPRVVIAVTEARTRIDGKVERAVQRLQQIVADSKQEDGVREEAVAVLCRLGPKARTAMDTFAELARHRSSNEPVWAARAYRDIARDNQTAVSLCFDILDGPKPCDDVLELLVDMDNIEPAFPSIYHRYVWPELHKPDHVTPQVTKLLQRAEQHEKPNDPKWRRIGELPSHLTPEHLQGGIGP